MELSHEASTLLVNKRDIPAIPTKLPPNPTTSHFKDYIASFDQWEQHLLYGANFLCPIEATLEALTMPTIIALDDSV